MRTLVLHVSGSAVYEGEPAEGASGTELQGSAGFAGGEGAPLWFNGCKLSYSDMYCVNGSSSPK